MYNNKWINVNENYRLKIEIYGTSREIYLFNKENKENVFYGSLDLKLNNDKKIYNEINNIKDMNELNELFKKINWM